MSKTLTFKQHATSALQEEPAYYLCYNLNAEQALFVKKYFMPTNKEKQMYNIWDNAWLSEKRAGTINNNIFRVMILLFAEQLWRDGNR